MGKLEDYTRNRVEGLKWALKIIEEAKDLEGGVKNLRNEVRFRNATFVPLEIPAKRIHEVNIMLARRLMNTILIVFLKIFEEVYDWRGVRLQRLVEQFAKHSEVFFDEDPYGDRYVALSDYAKYFQEEYGIVFNDEVLDEMMSVEAKNEDARVKRVQFDVIEKLLKNSYPEALKHLKESLGM